MKISRSKIGSYAGFEPCCRRWWLPFQGLKLLFELLSVTFLNWIIAVSESCRILQNRDKSCWIVQNCEESWRILKIIEKSCKCFHLFDEWVFTQQPLLQLAYLGMKKLEFNRLSIVVSCRIFKNLEESCWILQNLRLKGSSVLFDI